MGGGGIFDESGNAFAGQIDEASVWTRALLIDEINGLFQGPSTVDFNPYIATDVRASLHRVNSTAYLRFPFVVADPASINRLTLRLRYDDGLKAWINGIEVASLNAPEVSSWNSAATQRHADSSAVFWQELDLTSAVSALVAGDNCLAIQGLNIEAVNPDFLLQAELVATEDGAMTSAARYFTSPTPGNPNGTGTADLGPIMVGASHVPLIPVDSDSLTVVANVTPAFSPVSSVQLHYRVMFGAESTLTMTDTGTAGEPPPVMNNGQRSSRPRRRRLANSSDIISPQWTHKATPHAGRCTLAHSTRRPTRAR